MLSKCKFVTWWASFGFLTFVFFFYVSLLCCNMGPFKPRRVCGIALARGIRFKFLFPTGFFFFFGGRGGGFVSGSVTGYRMIG